MAKELLRAKQNCKKLGKNLSEKFLNRHILLMLKYSSKFDQRRFLVQNRDSKHEGFNLYLSIKAQNGILDKDVYNKDENSYMMSIAESSKIVFSKIVKTSFYKPS